jgi:hypothetical protein
MDASDKVHDVGVALDRAKSILKVDPGSLIAKATLQSCVKELEKILGEVAAAAEEGFEEATAKIEEEVGVIKSLFKKSSTGS